MRFTLRLTQGQHSQLKSHLIDADQREAAALVLCGRRSGTDRHVFVTREIVLIPKEQCDRTTSHVRWPTRFADDIVQKAMRRGMAIVKLHSHPKGFERFSELDDHSDRTFFQSVSTLLEDGQPHCSAVMLPEGRIFARAVMPDQSFGDVGLVSVVGDDLQLWHAQGIRQELPEFVRRHAQAFGSGTVECLRRLSISVVGCSGTGSPLIEQLVRLGVGHLLLIDPDHVERKNLNRIYMTKVEDAERRKLKVDVLARAIERMGLGTHVSPLARPLESPESIKLVAESDIVFGCMDSASGRDLLNRLATFYVLPYFDLGVQLSARP